VEPGVGVYNLGVHEISSVEASVAAVCRHLGVRPEVAYAGGTRGWVGDSPLILLDCSRLRALGWAPTLSIAEAVERTLAWFDDNRWIFERREAR
jgi:UDP-glucose 4-epimerase